MKTTNTIITQFIHPKLAAWRLIDGSSFSTLLHIQELKKSGYLNGVSRLIDAGAHEGTFSMAFARICPEVPIWCFEPCSATFLELKRRTKQIRNLKAINEALGSRSRTAVLSVGELEQANSLMEMSQGHIENWPLSVRTSEEHVKISTIDSYADTEKWVGNIFLKSDVQGYEMEVFIGARRTLGITSVIQVECSLIELYRNAPTLSDIYAHLTECGFRLIDAIDFLVPPGKLHPVSCDLLFARVRESTPTAELVPTSSTAALQ